MVGSAIGGAAGAAFDYNEAEPEFRSHWELTHHKAGSHETWEEASSAYRYGWESHDRPEYQNRSWDEVHPHLQKGWTGTRQWSEYEPLVREAWDRRSSRQAGSQSQITDPAAERRCEPRPARVDTFHTTSGPGSQCPGPDRPTSLLDAPVDLRLNSAIRSSTIPAL